MPADPSAAATPRAPAAGTGVAQANEALADRAGLPDGPNVAPSPREHLAAQGQLPPSMPQAGPDAGVPQPAPPDDDLPGTSPEEQELVDEQQARDREASRKVDPAPP